MTRARYEVRFTPRAEKDLKAIDRVHRRRIARATLELAENPTPPASRVMKGRFKEFRRLRVGRYRVVYKIDRGELYVFVIRLGRREDIYRALLQFLATLT